MYTKTNSVASKEKHSGNSLQRKSQSSAIALQAVPVIQLIEAPKIIKESKTQEIMQDTPANTEPQKIASAPFQLKTENNSAIQNKQFSDTRRFTIQNKKNNGALQTGTENLSGFSLNKNSIQRNFLQRQQYSVDPGVLQLRGENPYNTAKSHEGMGLTAHHIVAHTKIVEAIDFLNEDQKKDILVASIPSKITQAMLENVKVKLTEAQIKDIDKTLIAIRARLVDKDDDEEINGIRINDIRRSFFEWQSGNQYYGPNTAIRAEPGASKDDMDTDGQYFNKTIYKSLKESGNALYGELAKKKRNETEASQLDKNEKIKQEIKDLAYAELEEKNEVIRGQLYDILMQMVGITKDVKPGEFNPNEWYEVKSFAELEELSKDQSLDRSHITKYAFFKIIFSEWDAGKYEHIVATNAGRSEFTFAKTLMKKSQLKGDYIYVPIEDAQSVKPTDKAVSGTLYDYLRSKDTATSSYLPRSLPLVQKKRIPLLKALHTNSLIKFEKYNKEVKRLSAKKSLTVNESGRLALFMKKRDSATKSAGSAVDEIAKIEAL